MSHYTPEELASLGIKAGRDVMFSRNTKIYGADIEIGDFSRIDDGCILLGNIKLGRRVHIAPYCVLYGRRGLTIGDFSGFGAFSCFHTEVDDYTGHSVFGPQVPQHYITKKDYGPIVVGRGVIGGTRCTYLQDIRINDGASIGAHSLVKTDCDAWTLYAGTPARAIRENSREAQRYWAHM